MYPSEKIKQLKTNTIMLDACILMFGINKKVLDNNFCFENLKEMIFDSFFNF